MLMIAKGLQKIEVKVKEEYEQDIKLIKGLH